MDRHSQNKNKNYTPTLINYNDDNNLYDENPVFKSENNFKINSYNNNNNYLIDSKDNLLENYCSRCKMRQSDFSCKNCNLEFCQNCDGYVHSMNTKKNHDRKLINNSYVKKSENNFISKNKNNDRDVTPNRFLNKSYSKNSTKFKTNTDFVDYKENKNKLNYNNNNSIDNVNINSFSNSNSNFNPIKKGENYIDEIKRMYDRENEDLSQKSNFLEKHLNEEIFSLKSQIEENNKSYNLNFQILKDNHKIEIKKIVNEKENEIKILFNKNRELEYTNSDLVKQLDISQDEIKFMKNDFNEKLSQCNFEIKKREEELKELKIYYEKRINFINENFNEDKLKIINNYEDAIEKLNLGYKENKDKYLSLINQQENDYKQVSKKMKIEEEKFSNMIENLKSELLKYKEENSKLLKSKNQLKFDLRSTEENLEKSKKETKYFQNLSKTLEEENENLIRAKEEVQVDFDKLHTLTHGKFRKKK